jgi:signal transduction histidine kinase
MWAIWWPGPVVRRRRHLDIAIAAVSYLVTMLTTAAGSQRGQLRLLAGLVAAVACGALVARRRWPLAVFVVSAVSAEIYLAIYQGHQGSTVLVAPLIAVYTVAWAGGRRRAMALGAVGVFALAGVHMMINPSARLGADNVALVALGALAVAAGDASRSRRGYLAEAQARACLAEHDRDVEAARQVTEERLRIARELHDVVGHHLALINVQAGVAAHVMDDRPERAREALAQVRTASRSALGELRDTVGLLRRPGEQPPVEPVTGLAGLPELLAAFRRSGLVIDERVIGTVGPVAAATDLAAYRVIQESLTNVCKHAGPTTVVVSRHYGPQTLRIVVDNAAPGAAGGRPAQTPPATGGLGGHGAGGLGGHGAGGHGGHGAGGHGVAGMRERVAVLGGTFAAGPLDGGGHRVTATLPITLGTL